MMVDLANSEVEIPDQGAARQRANDLAVARRRKRLMQVWGVRLVSITTVLTIWEIFGGRVDPLLFAPPSRVLMAGIQMALTGELWNYLWPSLVIFAVGLSIATVTGIVIGILLARYWILDIALGVYLTFLYSTPTVALVPLIVLWAGFQAPAKIIILFMFAFFPMAINTYQGVKSVDPNLLEVGQAFRCNERQVWLNIILPAALPYILTGFRLAVGRGLIGMVLADLYTAISGIGYLIVINANNYQVDKMLVPIVLLGFLGVSLTALVRVFERLVAPWMTAVRD